LRQAIRKTCKDDLVCGGRNGSRAERLALRKCGPRYPDNHRRGEHSGSAGMGLLPPFGPFRWADGTWYGRDEL